MKITGATVFTLIDLTTRMRRCQRKAARTHEAAAIREAIDMERRVDGLLNEIKHGNVEGLFDNLQTLTPPTEIGP